MGVYGNVCCIAVVVKDSVFSLGVLKYVVAVLNAAFCMNCSLLILVEDARGDHMEEACSRVGLTDCLVCSHEYLLLFTPSCCGECSYYL